MENKNRGIVLLFLLVFFGAIILFNTVSNVEIEIKDKAEDIVFAKPVENITDNITDEIIYPIGEEDNNNTFEPVENYTHPLEGQIINWYYLGENPTPTPTPTPTTPAIPEFSTILMPMLLMLASLGRIKFTCNP